MSYWNAVREHLIMSERAYDQNMYHEAALQAKLAAEAVEKLRAWLETQKAETA